MIASGDDEQGTQTGLAILAACWRGFGIDGAVLAMEGILPHFLSFGEDCWDFSGFFIEFSLFFYGDVVCGNVILTALDVGSAPFHFLPQGLKELVAAH